MGRAARTGIGLVLIGLGVIGVLMPLVPGAPFFIAGAALLGPDHPLVRPVIERFKRWRRRGKKDPR